MRPITRHLVALGATAALLGVPAAATANERPADAGQGNRAESTEDRDTNDGGTPDDVVDDGDNAHPSGKDRSVEHGRSGNQGKAKSDPDDDGRGPDRSNGGADQADGPGGIDKADQDGNNGCGNDDDFEDDNEGWCGAKPKSKSAVAARPQAKERSTAPAGKASGEQQPERKPSPKPTPERATTGSDGATAETSVTAAGSPAPTVTETRSADAVARDDQRPAPTAGPSPVVQGPLPAPVPVVTEVLGVVLERPADAPTALPAPGLDVIAAGAGVQAVAAPAAGLGTALPRTGADALPTALIALLALAGGVVAVRRTRSV